MAQGNAATTAVRNIWNTTELKEKILFTLLCLLIYRVGAHVTAPGVNPAALVDFFKTQSNGGGLLGLYDLFTGGQLSRATVFALGIMPYISASIFQQIAGAVVPQIEKMQKDEEGETCDQWSRYATVLAWVQRLRTLHRIAAWRRREPGVRVPPADGLLPNDGRGLRHVARRADHRAGSWEWRELDDLLLDRRAHLAGHR
jgi:preprotein translocase subunit SecY